MVTSFGRTSLFLGLLLFLSSHAIELSAQQPVPSPDEHLGLQIGADRQLARWDQIVSYLGQVDEASERVQMEVVGETTLGNPFVLSGTTKKFRLAY